MTERQRRRRRPHPAAAGRVLAAGLATAGTVAMAGAMTQPVHPAGAEAPDAPDPDAAPGVQVAPTAVTDVAPAPAAPTRVIVVRRHHPAPPAGGERPAPVLTSSIGSPAPSPRTAPAPAPAPAPRAAAPTTQTRGS